MTTSSIPRVLHQMAPADGRKWHPIWRRCQESWLEHFAGFDYQMWDDERIDQFVRESFPEYYPAFAACPLQIIRIDLARYLILHRHGGVYADMDMYCYCNFVGDFVKPVHLVEVHNEQDDETVQNSLMAGVSGHPFFELCAQESLRRLQATDPAHITRPDPHAPDIAMSNVHVRAIAGPILLSDVYERCQFKEEIGLLPRATYNAHHLTYREDYRTKHMLTGRWGEIVLDALHRRRAQRNLQMTDKEYEKQDYLEFRSVSADNFDFRRNYLE